MPKKARHGTGRRSKKPTPVPLMQMITGFWASKALSTAVELDLFTKLSDRGVDVKELTQLLGLHPRPAEMILSACAALGLLEEREGHYYNSPLAEEFLVKGKPYYFGGVITMLDRRLYSPWNRLTEALKTNRAQTFGDHSDLFEVLSANPEEQRIFTEAMHSFSVQSGKALAEAFDFPSYTQLLDVGGASGAYCIEVARSHPHLRAVVFDLPPPLEIAKEKIADAGLSDRIKTHPGDFFREELPKGSDVILLSMILHDWAPDKNRMILRKCFNALPPGGALIVSELMMDDDKTGPVSAALMSLNMLIETEGGRNYTWSEYTEWLEEVGFRDIRRVSIESPGANGILIGIKPKV